MSNQRLLDWADRHLKPVPPLEGASMYTPLLKEADPELERLLDEEEAIENGNYEAYLRNLNNTDRWRVTAYKDYGYTEVDFSITGVVSWDRAAEIVKKIKGPVAVRRV